MPHRRVFVAAFAFVVVIAGSWVGSHFVRPLPAPRWTSSDLPSLPPERDNVHALLDSSIRLPDFDDLLVDEGTDIDPLMGHVQARETELRTALAATEEARAAIRHRPRFVEASGMLGRSRVLEGLATWKVRSLGVLLATLDGEHDLASEEVASMWTQAIDYSTHCQSMISCIVAQRLLQLTLGSVELLAERSPRDLEWLARLIESSVLDRSAIGSGIIAEYVYARVALETYEAPLFDRAQTDAMLADHFESALAFARDVRNPRPVAEFRGSALWWLYNPAGKRLADGSTVQHLDQLIERYGVEADALRARRDQVVARLTWRAADGTLAQLAGEDARAVRTLDAPESRGGREGE